ncbi:MAG: hypothetical protein HQ503_03670 [Rhodospirillales bacterium]|nr:hypothetical protein [Rhodospirillales bacterium]
MASFWFTATPLRTMNAATTAVRTQRIFQPDRLSLPPHDQEIQVINTDRPRIAVTHNVIG